MAQKTLACSSIRNDFQLDEHEAQQGKQVVEEVLPRTDFLMQQLVLLIEHVKQSLEKKGQQVQGRRELARWAWPWPKLCSR